MIPSTAASLLALLACVAPGLVFQLRRERFHPAEEGQSAFRETSRVALASLLFTTAALVVVVWLSTWWSAMPDLTEWLRMGQAYVPDHYQAVTAFLALEVAVACLLAVAAERLTRSGVRGQITAESILFRVFRHDFPVAAKRIGLWVTTGNGTEFKGALRHYTTGTSLADRELALGGSSLQRLPPGADPASGWEPLADFDAVVIPGSDIRHIAVQYLSAEGAPLRASPRRTRVETALVVASSRTTRWSRLLRKRRTGQDE